MLQISRDLAQESLNAISAFSSTLSVAQATVLNALLSQLGRSLVPAETSAPSSDAA